MAISKRREYSRGNPQKKYHEKWVYSYGMTSQQVSVTVGSVIDFKIDNDKKFYLVRTLYSDPNSNLAQEAERLKL